ncbi:6231_t:CDS:2, partial [Funneliformis mosseae]
SKIKFWQDGEKAVHRSRATPAGAPLCTLKRKSLIRQVYRTIPAFDQLRRHFEVSHGFDLYAMDLVICIYDIEKTMEVKIKWQYKFRARG